jgi:hypothetical protein
MQLSSAELKLVQTSEYPLLKLAAMEKIKHMLQLTANELLLNKAFNHHIGQKQVKISAGENYLNLPYLVADIPKLTVATPHLHIRLLFWWGNYFAFQFFIDAKQIDASGLLANIGKADGVYILLSDNIWHNNINDDCWKLTSELTDADYTLLMGLNTIKCCGLHPIEDYDTLSEAANRFYEMMFNLL